jgi:hypothetical protein
VRTDTGVPRAAASCWWVAGLTIPVVAADRDSVVAEPGTRAVVRCSIWVVAQEFPTAAAQHFPDSLVMSLQVVVVLPERAHKLLVAVGV